MDPVVVEVCLAIISIVGVLANIPVLFILLWKRNGFKTVHSSLLLALAVQDILTSIGLLVLPGFFQPSDAFSLPKNPWSRQLFCSIVWSRYLQFSIAIASVYTCLMLALDRWVAIFRPMFYRRFSISTKVMVIMVTIPWVLGFSFEMNTALNVRYIAQSNGTSPVCDWKPVDTSARSRTITTLTFIGMIALPAILMILVYTQIVLRRRVQASRVLPQISDLRRDSISSTRHIVLPKPSTQTRNQVNSESVPTDGTTGSTPSLKRLTRIACAASTVVVVCWMPDQVYFCLFQLGLVDLQTELHDCLLILAFLNASLNPILYCFSDKENASAFLNSLWRVFYRVCRTNSSVA